MAGTNVFLSAFEVQCIRDAGKPNGSIQMNLDTGITIVKTFDPKTEMLKVVNRLAGENGLPELIDGQTYGLKIDPNNGTGEILRAPNAVNKS